MKLEVLSNKSGQEIGEVRSLNCYFAVWPNHCFKGSALPFHLISRVCLCLLSLFVLNIACERFYDHINAIPFITNGYTRFALQMRTT